MYRSISGINGIPTIGPDRRKTLHTLMLEVVYSNVVTWAPDAKTEYRLPNGRIADVYCTYLGERIIIEVKVTLKQSIIDEAISKYWRECDYLMIAAPPEQWNSLLVIDDLMWRDAMQEKIGQLHVTAAGITLIRTPKRLRAKTGP